MCRLSGSRDEPPFPRCEGLGHSLLGFAGYGRVLLGSEWGIVISSCLATWAERGNGGTYGIGKLFESLLLVLLERRRSDWRHRVRVRSERDGGQFDGEGCSPALHSAALSLCRTDCESRRQGGLDLLERCSSSTAQPQPPNAGRTRSNAASMSTAERPHTPPDEGEHDLDTCSTDSYRTDPSSGSDRAREALNEEVRRPRTNLLSLPPELHYEIFKHLENVKSGKRPICRALWPMTRRNTFQDVYLMTSERLQRFASLLRPVHGMYRDASLLQEVRQTGRLIRALTIFVPPPWPRRRSATDSSAADDSTAEVSLTPGVMPDTDDPTASSHVRAILSQATELRRLTMSGPRALEYLVPAKSGFRWLLALEQLTLVVFGGSVQHWNAEHLSRLRRFRRLKELHLDLTDLGNFASQPTASQTTLLPVPQLHQFHLSLESSAVPTELARCVTLFTDIKKLVVDINHSSAKSFLRMCRGRG